MKIDAHVHFWNYNRSRDGWITEDMNILQRDFLPVDIIPVLADNEIDGIVAVQADQSEMETIFLNHLATGNPFIKGVVGWVDLKSIDLDDRLDHFSKFPLIKGFRHIVQAENKGFMLNPDFLRGVMSLFHYDYTYDILVHHSQLPEVLSFVEKLAGQKLILDHLGKPDVRQHSGDSWQLMIRELSLHNSVYCKLSGLLTEARWKNWTTADLFFYLEVVFTHFGAKRIVFGSDWPVLMLSGTYGQWMDVVSSFMEQFTETDKQGVWGENASLFYDLKA